LRAQDRPQRQAVKQRMDEPNGSNPNRKTPCVPGTHGV
jgi:hypothetical protein